YTGHHGNDVPGVKTSVAPGAASHAILAYLDPAAISGRGSLYKVSPLEPSTTPLLMGTIPNHPAEPVAWTNEPRFGHSRVFYTSLGHAEDFKNPAFRQLLLNGICWTLNNAPPVVSTQ
ncbi:MAG: ThuA domain-containing protein, partial [Planctomycetota bacterium]